MGRFHIAILGLTAALLVTPVSAFEFPALRQPNWQELSPQQKQVLAPLSDEWDQMEDDRRRKWLSIAARYPHLKKEEQARIHAQMGEWVRLTPQQKQAIRARFKSLPPEKRASLREQWERYQELPEEEKQRLQEEAARKKAEAQRVAREKARQATSVLSAQSLRPGRPSILTQQVPAPVTTIAPTPVTPAPPAAPATPPSDAAAPADANATSSAQQP